MENKADVKAIMARFQASGCSTEETSSTPPGHTKQVLQPTLSSGPSTLTKKPVLESLSGSAINATPKPAFLKNSVSIKSNTEAQEPNKTKALASRFANTQDDTNTNTKPLFGNKQQISQKPPLSQPPEAKSPIQKPPVKKPSFSSTTSDSKPPFPKLATPAVSSKPSWIKEDSGGGVPPTTGSIPKAPPLQQKPSSSIIKLWQQNEEQAGANTDTTNKPSPLTNSAAKPTSNFRTAQNMFNKEKDKNEQSDSGGANKTPLTATNSIAPKPPAAAKKPSLKKPPKAFPQLRSVNGDGTSGPKRNPLPNSLALGPAPAKPPRPPRINLESFKRPAEASTDGPSTFKKPVIPPPQSSHPSNQSNHVTPTPPPQSAGPSLPPRHPGSMIQQEEVYDDVDEVNSCPPPLPPSTGHPSQRAKEETEDDDGEMYEDLDERWEAAEQKQEKKREKDEKEEKKRLEAEKKEQKEREKKEQDARKKFKLVGPLEVIHQGKACVDCRGSKTDLCLKQGDCLDIIRVQGNPEGKWLGRTQDGSIGYVKTTSVEIDFNTLKSQAQQPYEPDVYDDIDVAPSDNSVIKGPGVVLPPLPGDGGEIYDDVVDPNLEVRSSPTKSRNLLRIFDRSRRLASTKVVPPPSQFTAEGNSDGAPIDEEIYDDVDSQNLPNSSTPVLKGKGKNEEMDPKKQKKFEKEEKDFRKKFKYDGEIQALYKVTIVHTLTNRKWSGKELPIRAGETLDVIVKAVDNKLICRNDEGKFGYVSTSYIVTDDGDIYDDVGDDCIYDND
ncbi:FYN-binding protein 1 isoform X2 [Toxotes jaculatrix]|uniref:FYN-binding protein 1 isoform X2 n=1 Tax=Toxotes jaculatrix TaxID=941984 RepID=UPI001B3A834A|nr:FYN-binding protein 1 isoform X2 [Toxotes jaculatrix]